MYLKQQQDTRMVGCLSAKNNTSGSEQKIQSVSIG